MNIRNGTGTLSALGLVVAGWGVSGCRTWSRTQRPGDAGVDTELTTQRAAPRTAPTHDTEPRPGFEQEPKQAP